MKNVIILASAADDLDRARRFYETQSVGLGEHCVNSVLRAFEDLVKVGGIHSRHHGYYRMINKTFHLGIYYRELGNDTLVVAVLDLRRDPNWITTQLGQRRT